MPLEEMIQKLVQIFRINVTHKIIVRQVHDGGFGKHYVLWQISFMIFTRIITVDSHLSS